MSLSAERTLVETESVNRVKIRDNVHVKLANLSHSIKTERCGSCADIDKEEVWRRFRDLNGREFWECVQGRSPKAII